MSNSKNKGHSHHDPASDEFRKEDFPFYWLARVHGRYTQNMERLLKKIDLDVPRALDEALEVDGAIAEGVLRHRLRGLWRYAPSVASGGPARFSFQT